MCVAAGIIIYKLPALKKQTGTLYYIELLNFFTEYLKK